MDLPLQIKARLDALGVLESDVEEVFIRGSGAGGQKINKTASTVLLRHKPSATDVRCQQERSQAANRMRAWELFCEKLEARLRADQAERAAERSRARRVNRKRSERQKALLVAEKRRRAETKAGRRDPQAGGGRRKRVGSEGVNR